ncbi:unnamed protein product [Trichobilharzia regenti]|nr:unnamed protein product [Trichobilharzia regenti]
MKETEISKKSYDDDTNNKNIIEQLENKVKATESKLSNAQNDLNHLQSQVEKNKLTIVSCTHMHYNTGPYGVQYIHYIYCSIMS